FQFRAPLIEFRTRSLEIGSPSIQLGAASTEFGTPSIEPGTPPIEFGTPSIESRTPSIESRTPSIESRTPSIEFGTPSIESRTPSIEFGTPSIEIRAKCLIPENSPQMRECHLETPETAKSKKNSRLTGLSDNVDHCGLATHDDSKRAAQCGAEILRISDRAFAVDAQAACNRRVIDVGIFDGGADAGVGNPALMAVGHALDMHDFLMVRA